MEGGGIVYEVTQQCCVAYKEVFLQLQLLQLRMTCYNVGETGSNVNDTHLNLVIICLQSLVT